MFLIKGFRYFNWYTRVLLTFKLGHDTTILKMTIFDIIDYVEFELWLDCSNLAEFCGCDIDARIKTLMSNTG